MAVPAKFPDYEEPAVAPIARDEVRLAAARLLATGLPRTKVALHLLDHLCPVDVRYHRSKDLRMRRARAKIRKWMREEAFMDLVYENGLAELEAQIPDIFKGIAKKAKRGRVDAARLVLEVTGRHAPKADPQPAQVVVAINGIPRPGGAQAVAAKPELLQLEAGD